MKNVIKLFSVLFLAGGVVFNGCKKPDNNQNNTTDPITGEYGSGTKEDPFRIHTVADLKRVGSGQATPGQQQKAGGTVWAENSHYRLENDINLSSESNWRPIGCSAFAAGFSGTFDGGGHVIKNLTITDYEDYDALGLFGFVDGTIKNVRLDGVKINVSGEHLGVIGGIAGKLEGNGTIEFCSVNGINITVDAFPFFGVGGVVGYIQVFQGQTTTVRNCMVTDVTIKTDAPCGGIAGTCEGTIENCYTTANVTSGYSAGGIVGDLTAQSIVQYCYATGSIVGGDAGGIAGENIAGMVQNCVALNINVRTDISNIGRIVGDNVTNAHGVDGKTINNYARANMTLTVDWQPLPISDISPTSIHGENVSVADYAGANSGTWWKNTVDFPDTAWDFAPNRLPHLKGFDNLTQNP